MSQAFPVDDAPVYDALGVGFGPSNLALALAMEEHNRRSVVEDVVTGLFVERQPAFGWHRGMLIDDATMQVSFLKDLVTLRNPASEFGFLSYLHSKNRLLDFINQKSLYPLRIEFHDYLEWTASKVDHVVSYGNEVTAVRPVAGDGGIVALDVVTRPPGGPPVVHRARNLVLATGLEPRLPIGAKLTSRVWHNYDLLRRVEALTADQPRRFVVVGAGQSAAEVVAFLHTRFPQAEVCAVFSRYGYSPADDSPFANRIFDPAAVDEFFMAPAAVKQLVLDYHRNTNYSVVDHDLIQDLYGRMYQESVLGRQRLRMLNVSRVIEVVEHDDVVRATVESLMTGEKTILDADAVIYATGYRPADPSRLLGELGRYCLHDDQGQLRVERDYRVKTVREVRCGIYLQGGTEHTHGITSSLLSNSAVRAGQILDSILARRAAPAPLDFAVCTGSFTAEHGALPAGR